jgi:hypothetical protein
MRVGISDESATPSSHFFAGAYRKRAPPPFGAAPAQKIPFETLEPMSPVASTQLLDAEAV